jgi:hypothetical protein
MTALGRLPTFKIRDLMKNLFFLLMIFSPLADADNEFSVEEHFANTTVIPDLILRDLVSHVDLKANQCIETRVIDALEASEIHLNANVKHIVIKPKSWCLCDATQCPMWIYKLNTKKPTPIWHEIGTGIEVLETKSKGYFRIKVYGHLSSGVSVWNGKQYQSRNYEFYK